MPVSDPVLTYGQVQPLVDEAVRRWRGEVGYDGGLTCFDVRIADLPGRRLGLAAGNTIWIDSNAAGWGWFVDATPRDDSEFLLRGNQGEQGRMDLLTVIAHEIGRLFGHDHAAEGVMHETLDAGERHLDARYAESIDLIMSDVAYQGKSHADRAIHWWHDLADDEWDPGAIDELLIRRSW
jgi:hypothetical protein